MTVTFVYVKIQTMKSYRVVFMGSPDFAVPTLQVLAEHYPVIGVVTQPDRPAGRGRKLTPPPVKTLAQKLELPIIQPEKLQSDIDAKQQIQAWEPSVIVVAAFGQILKTDVLTMAPYGCINVHASLLPRWRGVSPIQAAILNGDEETGVTIMKMDDGIDTGQIISSRTIPISADDTGGSLFGKLSSLGAELLMDTLPKYFNNEIHLQEQGESPTPYAPMLNKRDGRLDFSNSACFLAHQVRAYFPWPGTYTYWNGNQLKILSADPLQIESPGVGVLSTHKGLPAIGTLDGILIINQLQPSGKKSMPGEVFLRGAKDWK